VIDVAYWRIASFRCDSEFGRTRGIAGIGEVRTNQSRFMSTTLVSALVANACGVLTPLTDAGSSVVSLSQAVHQD
jgi:hypothetical protein